MRMDVRRLNSRRTYGTANPPATCVPAMPAAAMPATPMARPVSEEIEQVRLRPR